MKTRTVSGNNAVGGETLVAGKNLWRLIVFLAMLCLGGAAQAQSGPVLTLPASVTTGENSPTNVAIGVSDTGVSTITVALTAKSSNTNLVPNAGLVFTGTGPSQQLAITPGLNKYGTATITIIATDGVSAKSTNTLSLTVTFTNYPPFFVSSVGNLILNENASLTNSFVISDIETAAASLTVQAVSTNTTLLPNANIILGGTTTNRTVKITPATNQNGTTFVTLILTDGGGATATNNFSVTVLAVNQPPIFTVATNRLAYNENYGPVTNSTLISNVSSGPANQAGESNYFVVNYAAGFFSRAPALDTNYNLTFQVMSNVFGTNVITFILNNNGPTTNGGKTTLTNTVTLDVPFVNQAPGYTLATNLLLVLEETASVTNKNFISALSVGPANQNGQTWTYTALTGTNSATNAFFAALPAVATNGILTFKPLAHSYGTNTVTLILTTSGKTNNGGINAFTNSFLIGIVQTNHAPVIVGVTNQSVLENGAAVAASVNVWDYDQQSSNLTLSATSLSNSLVTVSITGTNVATPTNTVFTVTYTPATTNTYGATSIQFVAKEGGFTTTTNLPVTVKHVNVAPSFTLATNQLFVVEESAGSTNAHFVSSLSVGPASQIGQTWSFSAQTVTTNAGEFTFATAPAVATNGTLVFKPSPHVFGTNTVTLIMTTSGTTTNGGVNACTNTFSIGVIQTNHAPVIVGATNQIVLENGPAVTNTVNVWDYDLQSSNLTLTAASGSNNMATVSIIATNLASASNQTYTVVYTRATNNNFGTAPITFIATEGAAATTNSVTLTVAHVNQAPTYTLATNFVAALENSGANAKTNFISALSVGPADESGETWTYTATTTVNNATNATFTVAPAVSTNGTLTFTPAVHSYGTNTVTLIMTDSGGTANGGVNAFTNTFQIGVNPTNQAPVIAGGTNHTVLENGAPVTTTINVWDYDRTTNLILTATSTSNTLASVSITQTNFGAVSNATFTVVITPATNAFGTAPILLTATEGAGGLSSSTNTLSLTIGHVNQPPTFTPSTNILQVLEESPVITNTAFLTNITAGPANQSGLTWTFTTTMATGGANNAVFAIAPYISTNGTLFFQPQAHSYGTNTVTVVMTNSGGTTNGGVNACTNTFLIGVVQVHHAPSIAGANNRTVLENGAPVTATITVGNYDLTTNMTLTALALSNNATISISAPKPLNASNVLFTVSYTPDTNVSGPAPIQLTATETGSGLASTTNLTLTIIFTTEPPSFSLSTNLFQVPEESPLLTNAAFLTAISAGPANESGETWSFTTTTDTSEATNAQFAVAPYLLTNGTLIFQPLPHSYGTNLVTVVMTDNAQSVYGGATSFTNSFFLGVVQTNHAPVIVGATDQSVAENGTPATAVINVWDYDLQSSNLVLLVTSPSNNLALATITATNIASSSNALFTVTFAGTNTSGTYPIQLVAGEGSLTTTDTLALAISYVNQAPSFTPATNLLLVLEESAMVTNTSFLTNLTSGPGNVSGQTWTFTTTTDTNEVDTNAAFAVLPSVDTNGTLTFEPLPHSYGTNTVTVVMTTTGSNTDEGLNAYTNTFLIGVMQTNHAPVIVGATDQSIFENGGAVTILINVWDYDQESSNLVLAATSADTTVAVVSISDTNLASSSNTIFAVTFTPATNAFGTTAIQFVATEGALSTTNSLNLTVAYVTQPPSFTPATNLLFVLEESPAVTNTGFLTDISVGPANQSGQTWTFTSFTDTNNAFTNAFFAITPYVTTNGTLVFQPLAHSYGTNTVTVVMTTSGSTDNGGVNTYTNSFIIAIGPTNHAPVIAGATDQTVLENGTSVTANINVWDYDVQSTNLLLTATSLSNTMATVSITATNAVSPTNTIYTLSFAPAGTNTFGTAPIQLVATENGFTVTNNLTVTVAFVNQGPSFTLASTNIVLAIEESGASVTPGFVSSLSVGPASQSGETWGFQAITGTNNATNAFFAVAPSVATNGTLTFQPLAHSYGTNTVTLIMTNSGGTANGGINAVTNTFQIGIVPTNHAPIVANATNQSVLENGSPVTAQVNVWDYDQQSSNLTLTVTSLSTSLATVAITATNIASTSNTIFTVVYTPATNVFGSVPIKFVAAENSLTSTYYPTLVISPVNQAPSYNLSTNLLLALEESRPLTNAAFLTAISVGPENQSGQTWTFTATTPTNSPTNAFFAITPTVATNGTLIFQPLAHSYGTNTVTVVMTTSGSTTNGGINSYTNSFQIGIMPTNHAPVIAGVTNQTVLENGAPVTASLNVWDYDLQSSNLTLSARAISNSLVTVSITATNVATASNTVFTVSFAGTNTSGAVPIQLVAGEGSLFTTNTLTLNITFVNQPPTFTPATNLLQVLEESALITNTSFLTNLSAGPANQAGQTWTFSTTTATNVAANAQFAVLPGVATNGTLTFQPLAHSYGTNTVTVVMTSSGSTTNGGVNASTNSFLIGVVQVNHAPVIVGATNQNMIENGAPVVAAINVWDYDIQSSNLTLTVNSLNTNLAGVSITATNIATVSNTVFTVAFTPGTNAFGTANFQLIAGEGSLFTTNTLALVITQCNQPPSYTPATNLLQVAEESGLITNTGFLTNITVGPLVQSGQTWTFATLADTNSANDAFFAVAPTVATNGTLIFQPLAHSYGTNTVTVIMTTSGSTTNGGVNAYTNSFLIGVMQINHAPGIAGATNQNVIENGAPVIAAINVWDYDLQSSNLSLTVSSLTTNLGTAGITATNIGTVSNTLFTVAFTPGSNVFGTASFQLVATEGALSTTNTMSLIISQCNQPPSFTPATNLLLAFEESGLITNSGFLTNLSVGPAVESGQTWTFAATTATNSTNNAFFAVMPSVATNGTLIFQPLAHSYGTNTVTVVMTDSGGTTNGGVNAYTNSFLIGILQTNHAPVIAGATNQSVIEGSTQTAVINVWDYDLLSSNLNLTVTSLSNSLATASVTATNIGSASNTLFTVVFTSVPNIFGSTAIQLVASEGSLTTTNTLLLTVTQVNQAPSYSLSTNMLLTLEETPSVTNAGFVSALSVGPAVQNGQTWAFTAFTPTTNAGNALFATLPAVSTNGTLTYKPLAHSYGTNTVTLVMTTSGSVSNGGVNAYTNSFQIGIIQTNHAPVILATNQTVLENGLAVTTAVNVWDYDLQASNFVLTATSLSNSLATVSISATNIITASNTFYTVVLTPAANAFGTAPIQLVATEGSLSTTNTLNLAITHVNQAPSYTLSTNVLVVAENAGVTNAGFVTGFSVGPADESGQTWTFTAYSATNNATNATYTLFPTVATNGTLTLKPGSYSYGTNLVTLVMTDSGGTASGGVNAYTNSFQLQVTQVPYAPQFTGITNKSILENGVTNMSLPFTLFDPMTTNFNVSCASANTNLVSVSVSGVGRYQTLLFTPVTNTSGSTTITVIADNGSLTNSTNFTLTVILVNQPPSFNLAVSSYTASAYNLAVSIPAAVTNISAGPANQSTQTVSFVVTNSAAALFLSPPAVDASGTLSFTPGTQGGTAIVGIRAVNSGGTANGGVNTSPSQTMTIIVPPNPFLTLTGSFAGLFYATDTVADASSGYLSLVLANDGTFAGYLVGEGASNVFNGRFNITNGTASVGTADDLLALTLDIVNGSESVSGSISNSTAGWNVPLLAYLAGYSPTAPTSLAGTYLMALPGFVDPAAGPAGDSVFSLALSANGTVSLTGFMADGTVVAQASQLSAANLYPLYAPLYNNGSGGSVIGWLSFNGDLNNNVTTNSTLTWFNEAGNTILYPNGFTNQSLPLVSLYDNTLASLLSFSSGTVILTGGNLPAPITNAVVISSNVITVDPEATNGLTLQINGTTGEISGSFVAPGDQTNTIESVILQNSTNIVRGYFLGNTEGGSFKLFGN